MRYLGVDYGTKRIGLAVSDAQTKIATPLTVLKNETNFFQEIKDICVKNNIGAIVVGESKDFNLRDNFVMKEIRPFTERLKKDLGVPVYLHPEFLTSREAEHLQGKNPMLDASAAALILKSYLESNE